MEAEPERLLRSMFAQLTTTAPPTNEETDQQLVTAEESRDSPKRNRQSDDEIEMRVKLVMAELKDWTSHLVQQAVPRLIETAMERFVRRESFEDRIEEGLIRVLSTWAGMSDEPNVLTTLVQPRSDE